MSYSFSAALHGETSYTELLKLDAAEELNANIRELKVEVIGAHDESPDILTDFAASVGWQLEVIADGTYQISHNLEQIEQSIEKLIDVVQCGFESVITRLDGIDCLLTSISCTLESPSATWANEQYRFAQKEYDRNNISECLHYLELAINGRGSSVGVLTAYNFNFLKGLALLGRADTDPPDVVNPRASGMVFETTAKYADSPRESGIALRYASNAFGLAGDCERALTLALESVRCDSSSASAHFAKAKAAFTLERFEDGIDALVRSLLLNPVFYLIATSDPDICLHQEYLDRALGLAANKLRENGCATHKLVIDRIAAADSWHEFSLDLPNVQSARVLAGKAAKQLGSSSFPAVHIACQDTDLSLARLGEGLDSTKHVAVNRLNAEAAEVFGGGTRKDLGIDALVVDVDDPSNQHGYRKVRLIRRSLRATRASRSVSAVARAFVYSVSRGAIVVAGTYIGVYVLMWIAWSTDAFPKNVVRSVAFYSAIASVLLVGMAGLKSAMEWLNGKPITQDRRFFLPVLISVVVGGLLVAVSTQLIRNNTGPFGIHSSELRLAEGIEETDSGGQNVFGISDSFSPGQSGVVVASFYANASPGKSQLVVRVYRDGRFVEECGPYRLNEPRGVFACTLAQPLQVGDYDFQMHYKQSLNMGWGYLRSKRIRV